MISSKSAEFDEEIGGSDLSSGAIAAWTEKLEPNPHCLEGIAVIPPIGVDRVQHGWTLLTCERNRDKLLIAPIESREGINRGELIEAPPTHAAAWRDRDLSHTPWNRLMIVGPLGKGVACTWLPSKAEVPGVLPKHESSVVDEQSALSLDRAELSDARSNATIIGLRCEARGDHCDVRIYYE